MGSGRKQAQSSKLDGGSVPVGQTLSDHPMVGTYCALGGELENMMDSRHLLDKRTVDGTP